MNPNWFKTEQVSDNIYLTREVLYFEANRANCWLVKVQYTVITSLTTSVRPF